MIDVLVIGGGNAALCAALMAREAGASVLLLEARAARLARRQFAAHPQPPLHARRAAGRARRRLSGRGVLAGPAQGHRRPDRTRRWRASRSAHRRPAATGCAATASTSSRRCRARCTSRAPTPSSWAAARRWSTPTTAAPRRSASASATTRRSMRSSCADGRFVAARIGARAHRGARLRARRRRLRVEPRVAARGLGNERARRVAGRQLPDPRHPLQHRRPAQVHARRRRRPHRRSDAGAHGRDRRPRAALRRRHLHAHRLRLARRRRQSRGRALLRRRRGLLAEALCDLGPARRGSSRDRSPTRSSMRRRSAASCRRCSTAREPTSLPELARALGLAGGRLPRDARALQRRVPRRHLRPHRRSTTARPKASRPPRRTGRDRSTRRRTSATRSGRA